jgi:hypothetical protein
LDNRHHAHLPWWLPFCTSWPCMLGGEAGQDTCCRRHSSNDAGAHRAKGKHPQPGDHQNNNKPNGIWISARCAIIIGCIIYGNQLGNAIQICFCIYVRSVIYIILTSGLSPILHRSIKLTPLTLNFTRIENEPWETVIFRPSIAALDLDVYRPTYTRPISMVGASSSALTSSKFGNC